MSLKNTIQTDFRICGNKLCLKKIWNNQHKYGSGKYCDSQCRTEGTRGKGNWTNHPPRIKTVFPHKTLSVNLIIN